MLLFFMDGMYLKLLQLVHINKVEMMITGLITILAGIHLFIIPLSMHWFIWPFFVQMAYRIRNHIQMESVDVHGHSLELKLALDIRYNMIVIKGSNKKYEAIVKINTNDNIYLEKDYILYRNSKLKISSLDKIQENFQKNLLEFTEEELKLAEMYTA